MSSGSIQAQIAEQHRPDLDNTKSLLTQLGATHVFTYDELSDRSLVKQVKERTSDRVSLSLPQM